MASAQNRNIRLAHYPNALCRCMSEAVKYASCVSSKDDVKKNDCSTEFAQLKKCFQKAMKDIITKK